MGGLRAEKRLDPVQRREVFDRAGVQVIEALRGLPAFDGLPITLEWRDGLRVSRGRIAEDGKEMHAAAFLRERRLVLDSALRNDATELRRILAHELFHFCWVRLGNEQRRSWERLLRDELAVKARGELGWSAESRKMELRPEDRPDRSRRWREYVCESFCDTAAFLFAAAEKHEEFTLARRHRNARQRWFSALLGNTVRF